MEFSFYLDEKTGPAKTGTAGPIPLALYYQYITELVLMILKYIDLPYSAYQVKTVNFCQSIQASLRAHH